MRGCATKELPLNQGKLFRTDARFSPRDLLLSVTRNDPPRHLN
jgi:hypothetical protein